MEIAYIQPIDAEIVGFLSDPRYGTCKRFSNGYWQWQLPGSPYWEEVPLDDAKKMEEAYSMYKQKNNEKAT